MLGGCQRLGDFYGPTCTVHLHTQFERNRAIRGSVIAISITYDLERVSHVTLRFKIIFAKFELGQPIRS